MQMLTVLLACAPMPQTAFLTEGGMPSGDEALDGMWDSAVDSGIGGDEELGASLEDLPVLFIHGITGDESNWDVARADLIDHGWREDMLFARTFDDPEWGCNTDNADSIDVWVKAILRETGSDRLQLVAHSMGTLSSRYYLKNLAEEGLIHTYVTLGGMHHGLKSSCSPDFPGKPCVWEEICTTGPFVTALNQQPTTPNAVHYVSIYGTGDETVPNWSSQLDGAYEISLEGLEHFGPNGVLERPEALAELRRALLWPAD